MSERDYLIAKALPRALMGLSRAQIDRLPPEVAARVTAHQIGRYGAKHPTHVSGKPSRSKSRGVFPVRTPWVKGPNGLDPNRVIRPRIDPQSSTPPAAGRSWKWPVAAAAAGAGVGAGVYAASRPRRPKDRTASYAGGFSD